MPDIEFIGELGPAWLVRRTPFSEAFPNCDGEPLRFDRDYHDWEWLKTQLRPSDELWKISSPGPMLGWYEGLAVVRDGQIVAHSLLSAARTTE